MLSSCFVLGSFERGVADVGGTVLAPVFGLRKSARISTVSRDNVRVVLTVDFQYSAMVPAVDCSFASRGAGGELWWSFARSLDARAGTSAAPELQPQPPPHSHHPTTLLMIFTLQEYYSVYYHEGLHCLGYDFSARLTL